jgi:hypothetical protein
MKGGRLPGRKLVNSITFRLDDDGMEFPVGLAGKEQRPISMMARILLLEALKARNNILAITH